MLADNPLLTVLGRRGRGAVMDALLGGPDRSWTVRDLARAADVPPTVASRTVKELAALGVVEAFRPGRDMVVRWDDRSAAARILQDLAVPDLRAEGVHAFAAAYDRPRGTTLLWWRQDGDDPADPLCPARIAIVVRRDEDAAFEGIGPALDAVEGAGWPRPEATTFPVAMLGDDPISRAVQAGTPLL